MLLARETNSEAGTNDGCKRLYITHLDSFGTYLRIHGQLNIETMSVVRHHIHALLPDCFAIDPTWPMARQRASLHLGHICLYKYIRDNSTVTDYEFVRVRILDVHVKTVQDSAPLIQVKVEYIDYGGTALVGSYDLLYTQQQDTLLKYPKQCSSFILMGVVKEFKPAELEDISRIILRRSLFITIVSEIKEYKFITMKWKEFNFDDFLVHQKNIGVPIDKKLFLDGFEKFIEKSTSKENAEESLPIKQDIEPPEPQHQYKESSKPYFKPRKQQHLIQGQHQAFFSTGGIVNNNNYFTINHNNNVALNSQMEAAMNHSQFHHLQLQHQHMASQMTSSMIMRPMNPRVASPMGSFRPMIQGFHVQNNQIPYAGPAYHVGPYNGRARSVIIPQTTFQYVNTTSMNYQHRQPSVIVTVQNKPAAESNSRRSGTATFKTNNLAVGNTYEVYVSYVENGPCLFSVQLATNQEALTNMMNKLERVQLNSFTEKPLLGNACIARYSEDGQLYRALITGVQQTACKVVYIDYGNAELVKYKDLYEIPDEFLEAKAFAIRFTLSGYKDLEPIDESLKKAFKDLMMYKNCILKVVPLEGPPLVQYCELYLQPDKNVLELLKEIQKCRLVYPKSEILQNNDVVEIRYIDSPQHFYVQKISNVPIFEELMDDMFLYYNKNQVVPNHLALGAPCIVKYENEWYRAEVMRADATAIIVRHVDFGYEQKVTKNLLSTIAEKHLKLPRQAVQCCLKGFENNELNKDLATNMFEMLAEESNRQRRSFTIKIFRVEPDGVHLVNLNTKDLNVMKKLYKLSMPFNQYLNMEKVEFNEHPNNAHHGHEKNKDGQENGTKTPSIASSNDVSLLKPKKNGQIHNSTALQNEERSPKINNSIKKVPIREKSNKIESNFSNNNQNSASLDWEKNSSASSVDNRDSRSSSTELKQKGRRQQQKNSRNVYQQQHEQNILNVSIGSGGDRRSVSSAGSGAGSNNQKNNIGSQQRSQNVQHRQNKDSQLQHHSTRPQSAPQGYSQQRQKGSTSAFSPGTNDANFENIINTNEQQQFIAEEYVALNHSFPVKYVDTPSKQDVIICWWISPYQFYTHLKSRIPEFEELMRDIQVFYKKKPLQQLQLKVGSCVIARHRKENLMYRARVTACNQMLRKYKVHFVDLGNQYTVTSEDIWQVEKRFAEFPCMAHLCSFSGIISKYDHLYIIDRMEKYLPAGGTLRCEYIEREEEMYYVNISLDGVSLKDTLISQGIISKVSPDIRLSLLAGQQIRAKFTSVKDMLNFKIHIDGLSKQLDLISSYDDTRYVKSNPDIAVKFKQFYEGKSFVVNVKDVNDNKVILLRPLMPLLKHDKPTYICQRPILLEKFEARVVYIAKPYRVFLQMVETETEMTELLNDMFEYYESNGMLLDTFDCEQICAAKGSDGNWYRARILNSGSTDNIEVIYIDYGNTEILDKSNLKYLDEKYFINRNAYAIELNVPIRTLAEDPNKSQQAPATDASVITKLNEMTLMDEPILTVKALEVRNNHLIGEIFTANGDNIVDELKKLNLIKCRDIDFMRKLLDKDNTNIFEYMEMVDLTLEDEDDLDKKLGGKTKNASSPKKKKATIKIQENVAEDINIAKELTDSDPIVVTKCSPPEEVDDISVPTIMHEIPSEQSTISLEQVRASTPIKETSAEVIEPPSPELLLIADSQKESVDKYANMEHAILSHCDNPGQFFVHPCDKVDQLRALQENLQLVARQFPPLMRVINGAPCISLYSVDKQWYRAKIIDAELTVLQFIDYGNTDCVSDTSDLKEMIALQGVEPLCIPCSLPIKPNSTADWVDAANNIFNDSYSKLLNFEYITRGDAYKKSFINLYIDGINIADRLIEDGYAKPLQLVISGENCFVSHINNITDFYIQYEKDSKALELIEIYLEDEQKLAKLEKFEESKIVAALYPCDELWYRAKLLKQVPDKGYEVLFIDYGNTSVSPDCREISEEIANLPPLSIKCALELPENCVTWSDVAEKKFSEITGQGETIFTVNLREPSTDKAIVHLLIDGHNINDDLEPLCEHKLADPVLNVSLDTTLQSSICENNKLYEATVSHTNSPKDFYVQLSKNSARLEDMVNSLNTLGLDVLKERNIGQLCAAVFSLDETLYRARILSIDNDQYRVHFIDFGNEAVASDLRELPHDLQELPVFCERCQVVGNDELLSTAISTDIFTQLIDECEGLVKVEFLEKQSIPASVKLLSASGEDLGEKLHELISKISVDISSPTQNTCIISHAISPSHFYIQPKSNSIYREKVNKALSKENAVKLQPLDSAELGAVCVIYSTEDDCYYRGRVQRILGGTDGFEIFLLDFGYTLTAKEIHELSAELRAIPALAWKCKLNDVPAAADTILEERFAAILEQHFGEIYEIELDEIEEDANGHRVHKVKLQANYKDLAEELAQAISGGDIANSLPEPKLHDCTIIHVSSPQSFYIQLGDDVPSVEKITDVLLDAETDFESFTDLHVGAICAAQFPDDLAFYRAKIVQVLEDGKCEVHYIDFGNNATTDQFRKLPEDMLNIAGFSKHCALDTNFGGNTAAIAKFQELIDSRFSETFQVELLKTTVDPQICRLFFQDKNVANEVAHLIKNESVM